MNCKLDYCIYNEYSKCVLNEIEIDSTGQCEECIIASLPQDMLARYKKEQLSTILNDK